MSEELSPQDVLDNALTYQPGLGIILGFQDEKAREKFRQRLFSAMSADAKQSAALDDRASPYWGTHRWRAVRVQRESPTELWIGRQAEIEVGTELVPPGGG